MPTPPKRPSRNSTVQEQIKDLILRQGLAPGDPMPTEAELMEHLAISRNSVREALKALQAVGIVEIRHGFGTYVGSMSFGALVDELSFHGRLALAAGTANLADLVDVREALEGSLITQVAAAADQDDLDALRRAAERMRAEAATGEVSPAADRQFHEALYRPVGNSLMLRLLAAFWDAYNRLSDELPPILEAPEEVAARHWELYEAVAAHDAERARRGITDHFLGIRSRTPRATATPHPHEEPHAAAG
ncbi:FadR/GntR family transcriptional regulator [Uniformispora flossi]|uniref:FadR/GntR family transcriptional regulator n=1 Tax=Uniformispora flossi TaxID=3390723 RepID=UPI003C2AB7F4